MTEIARETHNAHARILRLQFAQQLRRGIRAAIVHVDNLESQRRALKRGCEGVVCRVNHVFLVETGHDDGKANARIGGMRHSRTMGEHFWAHVHFLSADGKFETVEESWRTNNTLVPSEYTFFHSGKAARTVASGASCSIRQDFT